MTYYKTLLLLTSSGHGRNFWIKSDNFSKVIKLTYIFKLSIVYSLFKNLCTQKNKSSLLQPIKKYITDVVTDQAPITDELPKSWPVDLYIMWANCEIVSSKELKVLNLQLDSKMDGVAIQLL